MPTRFRVQQASVHQIGSSTISSESKTGSSLVVGVNAPATAASSVRSAWSWMAIPTRASASSVRRGLFSNLEYAPENVEPINFTPTGSAFAIRASSEMATNASDQERQPAGPTKSNTTVAVGHAPSALLPTQIRAPVSATPASTTQTPILVGKCAGSVSKSTTTQTDVCAFLSSAVISGAADNAPVQQSPTIGKSVFAPTPASTTPKPTHARAVQDLFSQETDVDAQLAPFSSTATVEPVPLAPLQTALKAHVYVHDQANPMTLLPTPADSSA